MASIKTFARLAGMAISTLLLLALTVAPAFAGSRVP
jgi:hypothetical protein